MLPVDLSISVEIALFAVNYPLNSGEIDRFTLDPYYDADPTPFEGLERL